MARNSISDKLREVAADIDQHGYANLTRLTVLKKWLGVSGRLSSFATFVAVQASRGTPTTSKEAAELFREAQTLLADVDLFAPEVSRAAATRLRASLCAFQNEHRSSAWAPVRLIHNKNLYLVESALSICLGREVTPAAGYRLAAEYCEHYDPRHGNCLNGPSRARVGLIIDFIEAVEAREKREST